MIGIIRWLNNIQKLSAASSGWMREGTTTYPGKNVEWMKAWANDDMSDASVCGGRCQANGMKAIGSRGSQTKTIGFKV